MKELGEYGSARGHGEEMDGEEAETDACVQLHYEERGGEGTRENERLAKEREMVEEERKWEKRKGRK